MKVALIVGHNAKSKGAYSETLKISEFDLFSNVAKLIQNKMPSVDVYKREDVGSYSKEMKKVIDQVNSKGYDLVLELHYNAHNTQANGAKMLHYNKSTKGIEYSNMLLKEHESLGLKNAGLIPVKDSSQNGSYGILHSKMAYILTESFFGDNVADCNKVNAEKLSNVFVQFLKKIGVVEIGAEIGFDLNKSLDIIQEEINKIKASIKK
ncbi:MAG: N-acetylmuramoyl-L-alanine amidase [Fusobacteriaceae bacterium]